jgi:hypothetical protein
MTPLHASGRCLLLAAVSVAVWGCGEKSADRHRRRGLAAGRSRACGRR